MYPFPRLLTDMVPAAVQRVRLHDGSPASAVGIIIHLHLLIGGILPDLVSGDGHQSSGLRPPDNGLPHHSINGVREQGHDVNPSSVASPFMFRTRMVPVSMSTPRMNTSRTAGIRYSRFPRTS